METARYRKKYKRIRNEGFIKKAYDILKKMGIEAVYINRETNSGPLKLKADLLDFIWEQQFHKDKKEDEITE